jgi:K+-sensing histidine kinase KdpD
MLLLNTDTLDDTSPIIIFLHIIALIGFYDVTQEMIEENSNILSENIVKKILLFAVLYLKTKSIFISSVCSIITVLLFHKVFFGPKTSSRKKC